MQISIIPTWQFTLYIAGRHKPFAKRTYPSLCPRITYHDNLCMNYNVNLLKLVKCLLMNFYLTTLKINMVTIEMNVGKNYVTTRRYVDTHSWKRLHPRAPFNWKYESFHEEIPNWNLFSVIRSSSFFFVNISV
jgi:hypothetical protein